MKSAEERLLKPTEHLLSRAVHELCPAQDIADARLTVLEVVAGVFAGWSPQHFWSLTQANQPVLEADPGPWADKILASLEEIEVPVPLALAALSREVLTTSQQRKTGAYYTDWRLAQLLAGASVPLIRTDGLWVDPACGSGILLVAAAMAAQESEREQVIRERLCGADLSERALRGSLLSVASLARELESVAAFQKRLMCQDSLRSGEVWRGLAPDGIALVIGNPPWERLKASRHEVAASNGDDRHYGKSFDSEIDLATPRAELLQYIDHVVAGTRLQGRGEHDLYKLFLELGLGLAAQDGILAMLVPAGLIRSQGTETLRRELNDLSRDLQVFVLENRQRHFAIDTRFKFLAVVSRVGTGRRTPLSLRVADRTGTLPAMPVSIRRTELQEVRPDLALPEVRTGVEWRLFARLTRAGIRVGDQAGPWRPAYRRELDMTNDQRNFQRSHTSGALPVIEGRHVGQFRSRAKSYRSGEGRAAIWEPEQLGHARLTAQWFIQPDRIRTPTLERTLNSRVGFCDITGQTNERSLLVARIPAGVVCGNKVPTLAFQDGDPDQEDLFIALANSLIVDWMLRRLVTTTVNFFLLDSLPLPPVSVSSSTGQELVTLARRLSDAEGSGKPDPWQVGQWRAKIDALVAAAWDVSLDEMRLVLSDFPLLDRGQSPLPGEDRSTITADVVVAALADVLGETAPEAVDRAENARKAGAVPYVPAEFV